MTLVVLFILAVIWLIYLASWLRSRRDRRGVNSISSFNNHLLVLERTRPAHAGSYASRAVASRPVPIYPAATYQPPRPPMSLSDARRRRRNVLYALAGAAVFTLVAIAFFGTTMMVMHGVTDILLAAYVVLLVRTQRLAAERRAKVRYLHPTPAMVADEPPLLLQRSAN